ncbi:mannose-1-phosphate guanyltransferase alpha-like isoform 2 [Corchorus olitorius]|uniref:Mannose-1-phosphate guanyltransferase alpha-like isoform 2 n=1 Tax=Corchorus olitorius TaxID=93759 RepID=A0A1R3IF09_9ROSI|nr:mannose-1-phosphate guanyltransferase alpha-like isoform 2 [Corchorus olitorius]
MSNNSWLTTIGLAADENPLSVVLASILILHIAGTGFRPLSLNIPKPLFPLVEQPMLHHPISACKRIPNLA